jgi:hypothetical protein
MKSSVPSISIMDSDTDQSSINQLNKHENIDFENLIYCPVSLESFFDNSLDNLDIKTINSFIETSKINPGMPIWFQSKKIGHERYVYFTKDSSLLFLIELSINPFRNPSVMLYDRRQL